MLSQFIFSTTDRHTGQLVMSG